MVFSSVQFLGGQLSELCRRFSQCLLLTAAAAELATGAAAAAALLLHAFDSAPSVMTPPRHRRSADTSSDAPSIRENSALIL